jgi:putative transcriptional regulator
MRIRLFPLLALLLLAGIAPVQAADLSAPVILVAKPELRDRFYGQTIIVARPLGDDQHIGFIVNRPTEVTLGAMFPEHGPSKLAANPVYVGGPVGAQMIFALVQGGDSPGDKSLQLMPGLFAVADEAGVDRIIESESGQARIVAGVVAWSAGELRAEIEQGAWYVLRADPALVMRDPQGLWEELVRRSQRKELSV